MKIFRIVHILTEVDAYKDKPISTAVRYRIEQYHYFMWIHWWKTPKFAIDKLFNYYDAAMKYIWEKYPDAHIL